MATATRTSGTGKGIDAPQWARMVKARNKGCFIDATAWETVFDADLGDWHGAEIEEVAAWMQSEGQDWPSVTCATDIVKALRTMRKQARESRWGTGGSGTPSKCGWCSEGILAVYKGCKPAWTIEDYNMAVMGAMPCNCDAGLYAAANREPWKGMDLTERAALRDCAADGKRDRARFLALLEAAYPDRRRR